MNAITQNLQEIRKYQRNVYSASVVRTRGMAVLSNRWSMSQLKSIKTSRLNN